MTVPLWEVQYNNKIDYMIKKSTKYIYLTLLFITRKIIKFFNLQGAEMELFPFYIIREVNSSSSPCTFGKLEFYTPIFKRVDTVDNIKISLLRQVFWSLHYARTAVSLINWDTVLATTMTDFCRIIGNLYSIYVLIPAVSCQVSTKPV